MKNNLIKGVLALALAAAGVYLRELLIPLIILAAVMLADYATGVLRAWTTRTLSSRIGLSGIVKKLACLFGVGVAITVDFVVQTAGERLGVALGGFYACGLLVTFWLILNECLSILENLAALGAPVPGFLRAVVARLKQQAEGSGDRAADAAGPPSQSAAPTAPPEGEPRGPAQDAAAPSQSAAPTAPPEGEPRGPAQDAAAPAQEDAGLLPPPLGEAARAQRATERAALSDSSPEDHPHAGRAL